jgi:hypothetical protein
LLTLFKLHCLAKPITLGIVWCQLGGPPHAKLFLKALTWQLNHVEATMRCFTNQISSDWLDITIVSMRWAVNFFLNLKVIKGSSSYAIREIVTCRPKALWGICSFFFPNRFEAIYPTNTNRYVPPFVLE